MDAPQSSRKTFSTLKAEDAQSKELYFMESGDKVRYFFEQGALDEEGQLIVDPMIALNKVGHALHVEHPTFKAITFSNRVREICWQLKFNRPAVCQSMYIFKNSGIGGEVTPHQDSWFLHTEPNSAVGFWFALEDCTLQNGCLQFIKGSHKGGVHRRYVRNPDKQSSELMVYDRAAPIYPKSSFTPLQVSKGKWESPKPLLGCKLFNAFLPFQALALSFMAMWCTRANRIAPRRADTPTRSM